MLRQYEPNTGASPTATQALTEMPLFESFPLPISAALTPLLLGEEAIGMCEIVVVTWG
jgi:hypothetical protein